MCLCECGCVCECAVPRECEYLLSGRKVALNRTQTEINRALQKGEAVIVICLLIGIGQTE